MRQVRTFQYQSVTAPPQTAQQIPPSFGWFAGLSEPKKFPRDPKWQVSGEAAWPYNQPATDNANVNWFQPLGEPRRFARDPRAAVVLAAAASGEASWPYNQPAADNANVNWFQPFGVPQRYPRDPRAAAALVASGEYAWPYNQPAVDNANTNWFAPLGEPRRFPRDERYRATLVASGEPIWPYVQPAKDNANTRWFQPLAEPRRFRRDPRWLESGETPWPYIQPQLDNRTVRWFQPLAEPQRSRPGEPYRAALAASGMPPWSTVTPPPVFDPQLVGYPPLSEPVRFARDPRYGAVLLGGEAAWPYIQPAFDNAMVPWLVPLAAPQRFLRDGPRYAASLAASGLTWPEILPPSRPLVGPRRPLLRGGGALGTNFATYWPGKPPVVR